METLIPIADCWVRLRHEPETVGRVIDRRPGENGNTQLKVQWNGQDPGWIELSEVGCGLSRGHEVQDVPLSTTRHTLGAGRVSAVRQIGGREQVLVQLHDTGESVWLPYENLRRIHPVPSLYIRAQTAIEGHAERFRLRLLAHALESWNQLTGALDRLDVDPLPHQIHLVHRILTSGNYNWLIADDVGLGKTIEVGLLLAALRRRGQARRVLIVTPAGLVRQWQDEMQFKFDQIFEIYGQDFQINNLRHWGMHPSVIVSMDLAKRPEQLERFIAAGGWDVVIFDEGHKLSRHEDGERTDRYRLAEQLRPEADAFVVLTATPHQGRTGRFIYLLELIRPDLHNALQRIQAAPEVVTELILRNRKTEVTDAEGQFIFRGQITHRVPIEPSTEMRTFRSKLDEYLRRGYKAAETGGQQGRAIGFVMTTYRKLASSSVAAIDRALRLRRDRILNERLADEGPALDLFEDDFDEGGDDQFNLSEEISRTGTNEFFEFEIGLIDEALDLIPAAYQKDRKLRTFLDDVVAPIVEQGKKLLVFTEYRATQEYLQQALFEHFPDCGEPVLINGSMKLEEKLESINAFNNGTRFLISTEAGGEGINLHQSCHVLVNYDLPWNPTRLVQRIGRLYRYGQEEVVVAFNLHAQDGFDNTAIGLMLDRVSEIAHALAPVDGDDNGRLHNEILGELLENIDMASILATARDMRLEHTEDQIAEAVERAASARGLQDQILAHASGFDAGALEGTVGFTMEHVGDFVRSMLPYVETEVEREMYDSEVLELRLPDDLVSRFPEFGNRHIVRVATNRRLVQLGRAQTVLDFESDFFRFLVETAKSREFEGLYAAVNETPEGALGAFLLRWQNDQGEPSGEEFVAVSLKDGGDTTVNPAWVPGWLISQANDTSVPEEPANDRHERAQALQARAEAEIARQATRFRHPNAVVTLAAADFIRNEE